MLLSYDDYTIGWIAALPHERAPARALLDEEHDTLEGLPGDNNTYTLGRIGKHNVVIAALPNGVMGSNAAANAVKDLIRSFKNVRFGLMVGIGGGVPSGPEDVRLGDIVVSTHQGRSGGVIQYDFGTKTQHAIDEELQHDDFTIKGFLRDPPTALLTAVANLQSNSLVDGYMYHEIYEKMLTDKPRMKQSFGRPANDTLYKAEYIHRSGEECSSCDLSQIVERPPRHESIVHYGVIGSGNQVIRDAVFRDKLYKQEKIICFEMEAAGLMNEFECLVIRGICDYCDSHKNKNWQFYAAAVAAAYAKELLLTLPARHVDEMPKSKILDTINNDLKKIAAQNAEILTAQQSSEFRDALNWIAAPDPEPNFRLALQRKDPETGAWIGESETYVQWKIGGTRHLWLYGKAGCGKSTLTATAIPDIQQHCTDNKAGFAMFYLSFTDTGKQSWSDCLKSLVAQLATRAPASSMLIQGYQKSMGRSPAEDFLRRVLIAAVTPYKQVFIAIDALDEAPAETDGDDTIRSVFLDNLISLAIDAPNIKFFLTSRDLIDIRDSMENLGASPIPMIAECVNRDIKQYVTNQLAKDKKLSRLNDDTKSDIETTLVTKADGMFRWVYCQLHQLKNLPMLRPKDIQRALKSLPKTLDETYERMLESIDQDSQQDALTLLRWLAYAQRPLSLDEIVETLTIDISREGFVDIDNRAEAKDIAKLLSGLVTLKHKSEETVDDSSDLASTIYEDFQDIHIQLAHFSVKEYLESLRSNSSQFHLVIDHDQHFLSKCCLGYLIHYSESELKTGTEQDLVTFPLLQYTAESWSKHYMNTEDIQLVLSFLQSSHAVDSWQRIWDVEKRWETPFSQGSNIDRGLASLQELYVASSLGLWTVVKALIELGVDINPVGYEGSAVAAAYRSGHVEIMEMLIKAGANVNTHEDGEDYSYNPLYNASRDGDIRSIQALVEAGANRNIQNRSYREAINTAAIRGSKEIVKYLIDIAECLNTKRGDLTEPLLSAVLGGQGDVMKTLIDDYGADPKVGFKDYYNALHAAVESYNSTNQIIKTLIEDYGMDVNLKEQAGKYGTVLQAAAAHGGNYQTVKTLLDAGADVNAEGGYYCTALQAATYNGEDEEIVKVVKLLLDAGAKVDIQGGYYITALHGALNGGHISCAEMLIHAGARTDIMDYEGRTAVHHILRIGNMSLFNKILATGNYDLSAKDRLGKTSLDYACMSGSIEMLRAFLRIHPDTEIDKDSSLLWSPIHWACRKGFFGAIELLSQAGIEAWTMETALPAVKWAPLDIVKYQLNVITPSIDDYVKQTPEFNLLWQDRPLTDDNTGQGPKLDLLWQGIVMHLNTTFEQRDVLLYRENSLGPAKTIIGFVCDGCRLVRETKKTSHI